MDGTLLWAGGLGIRAEHKEKREKKSCGWEGMWNTTFGKGLAQQPPHVSFFSFFLIFSNSCFSLFFHFPFPISNSIFNPILNSNRVINLSLV
jgi:hypothetical protein